MEIIVNVTIHESSTRKTFLLTADDEIYDEVFGLDNGLNRAISEFVENFNAMRYHGKDDTPILLTNEDIVLANRLKWKIRKI